MASHNAHYWEDRTSRSKKAQEHTKEMQKKYSEEIKACVEQTEVFGPDFHSSPKRNITAEIAVEDTDSVSSIFEHVDGKTAVLNFASYKNPGGGFLDGSKAQEECLCHESFLYNVLLTQQDYYEWNNAKKNKGLYCNRALYSPNVLFEHDGRTVTCDVITCAAPNKSGAQKYNCATEEENRNALQDRIRFILDIAQEKEANTLILGAWGCGVFGQNAKETAELFKEELLNHPSFRTVIFAVPKSNNPSNSFTDNYNAFHEVFGTRSLLHSL